MTVNHAANPHAILRSRLRVGLRRWPERLSARLHATDDEFARQAGWQVIKVTRRFGFTGRIYRDPRFGTRTGRPPQPMITRPTPQGRNDGQHHQ